MKEIKKETFGNEIIRKVFTDKRKLCVKKEKENKTWVSGKEKEILNFKKKN